MIIFILFMISIIIALIAGIYIGGTKGRPVVKKYDIWSIDVLTTNEHLINFDQSEKEKHLSTPALTAYDVTDVNAHFIADPFLIKQESLFFLFFEVLDRRDMKGKIGLATSEDGIDWTYKKIVLEQSFHLSYPYVFKWNGSIYMIPETHQSRSINLYKAEDFPYKWVQTATLIEGAPFSDASIFYYENLWWLFTSTEPRKSNNLRLYYADDLLGKWKEHPSSPIIEKDAKIARPAGRVQMLNGTLYRFAQECSEYYGKSVSFFEITELTKTTYSEALHTKDSLLLYPGISGWNKKGMHHIDSLNVSNQKWLTAVDGQREVYLFGLNLGGKIRIIERKWLQDLTDFIMNR